MSARTRKACDCFYKVLNVKKPSLSSYYLAERARMSKNYVLLKNHFERIKTTFDVEDYELIKELLDKAFLVLNDEGTERAYRGFGQGDLHLNWLEQQREQHSCQKVTFVIDMVKDLFACCQPAEQKDDRKNDNEKDLYCGSDEYCSLPEDDSIWAEEAYHNSAAVPNTSSLHPSSPPAATHSRAEEEIIVVDDQESTKTENMFFCGTSKATCIAVDINGVRENELKVGKISGDESGRRSRSSSRIDSESKVRSDDNVNHSPSEPQNGDSVRDEDRSSSSLKLDGALPKQSVYASMSPLLQQHARTMVDHSSLNTSEAKPEDPWMVLLSTTPILRGLCSQAAHAGSSDKIMSNTNELPEAKFPETTPKASSKASSSNSKSPFISFRGAKKYFSYLSTLSSSSSQSDGSSNDSVSQDKFSLKTTSGESDNSSSSRQELCQMHQQPTIQTTSGVQPRQSSTFVVDDDMNDVRIKNHDKNNGNHAQIVVNRTNQIISIKNHYSSKGTVIFVCELAIGSGKTKRDYSIQLLSMKELLKGDKFVLNKLKHYIRALRGENMRKYRTLMRFLPEKMRAPSKRP